MESALTINVSLCASGNKTCYGKFSLGTGLAFALNTFDMLKGSHDLIKTCMIEMELNQEIAGLEIPVKKIFCNLDQLKENAGLISREIFLLAQLEGRDIRPLQ